MKTTSRSRRVSALVVLFTAVGIIAALAPAASAGSPAAAVFRGCALVEANNAGADAGLFFPGVADGRSATWEFTATNTALENKSEAEQDEKETCEQVGGTQPTGNFCKAIAPLNKDFPPNSLDDVIQSCKIHVEGVLGSVAHPGKDENKTALGGWCGFSAGWNGRGFLKVYVPQINNPDNPVSDFLNKKEEKKGATHAELKLYKVGWLVSAGSILPVTGRWYDNDDVQSNAVEKQDDPQQEGYDPKKKQNQNGTVVALVQASGGQVAQDCAGLGDAPNGLQQFDVNAVAALV